MGNGQIKTEQVVSQTSIGGGSRVGLINPRQVGGELSSKWQKKGTEGE